MKFCTIKLILLTLLWSCKNYPHRENSTAIHPETKSKGCIDRIIEQDSILGEIRNNAPESISLSEAISSYAKNSKLLNFTHCPGSFKSAYEKHIEAWLELRKVSDKYPSLRGELHEIFSIIEKSKDSMEYKSHLQQILDTWERVVEESK